MTPTPTKRHPVATPLRAWATLALCVPLALLGACAANDKLPPVTTPKVIESPRQSTVVLTDAQDGASVVLDAAQALRVELPNDAWAVTHNLEWSLVDVAPGVLAVLGSRFERSTRNANPSEAAGDTVWRIQAQAPGRVALTFVLRRRYSLEPATQTVRFDVTVR